MQDTALYEYLLGLKSPWTVSRVTLDVNGQRVDVWAEHPEDAVSADARSPHNTELKSPLNTESQCPFTAHHDGGGTNAAQGGLHDDSGIGSTWALSL